MSTTTTEESSSLLSLPLPRCKILLRSKDGVELYDVPERDDLDSDTVMNKATRTRQFLVKGLTTSPLQVAPNGSSVYAHLSGVGIIKCNISAPAPATDQATEIQQPQQPQQPFFANTQGVQMMDLSPKGTYLLTWERWYPDKCPYNLKLWETSSGKLIGAFQQKTLKRDAWPYLQWNHDECVAALHATNEVRFYTPTAFSAVAATASSDIDDAAEAAAAAAAAAAASQVRFTDKIRITGITSMSLPRQANPSFSSSSVGVLFTAFCPGTKDKPARASLYEYRSPGHGINNTTDQDQTPILSKSLFQAEEMKVHWSPNGDAALITLQTAVDASGQSYYGSSQLFLLRKPTADKQKLDDGMIAVPLPQEGPVLDVQWMPNASKPPCFAVIAGKMPAMTSLHHGLTGKATFLFGNNVHRNTLCWAPHGRFICIAGFGNLAGGMSFWDRNKLKLITSAGCANNVAGTVKAEAVVGFGWSPDSRIFFCSTCTPRMNVDNGVRLFRYNGQEIQQQNLPWDNAQYYRPDKLLEACFVPAPTLQTYPDRPQSPLPPDVVAAAASAPVAAAAAATPVAAAAAPKPAGRYVPPSQRNKVGGVVGAGDLGGRGGGSSLAERMRREKEGKVQTAVRVVDKPVVKDPHGRVVVGMAPAPTGKTKSAIKREKMKQKKQQQPQAEAVAVPPKEEATTASAAAARDDANASIDPEKRSRKLKKMLKQIEELKQKDASTLNEDQKSKIASQAELEAELASLGVKD